MRFRIAKEKLISRLREDKSRVIVRTRVHRGPICASLRGHTGRPVEVITQTRLRVHTGAWSLGRWMRRGTAADTFSRTFFLFSATLRTVHRLVLRDLACTAAVRRCSPKPQPPMTFSSPWNILRYEDCNTRDTDPPRSTLWSTFDALEISVRIKKWNACVRCI